MKRWIAKLLQQELYDILDQHTHELDIDIALDHAEWVKRNQLLIAQRAYDLVCHVSDQLSEGVETLDREEFANFIPDLTEWPKPQ